MRHFQVITDIAAPPDRVWEVMRDVERWPEWTPSIERITRLEEGALSEGSRVVIKQPKFPPAEWTVTALAPMQGFTWVSAAPGFRATGRHAIDGVDGGSRVTLSLDYQGVLGGVLGALTQGITQRYIALEASGLKARSEDPTYHRASVRR
jgi:uncharacterized membrane protein